MLYNESIVPLFKTMVCESTNRQENRPVWENIYIREVNINIREC